jgi:SNF2 family DNA or RNA helicase
VGAERKRLDWIPDSLEYYPHQVDGVRELARLGSAICGDEMGLGKSVEALTVFAVDVQAGWGRKLLVVAPATLKSNWWAEIMEHTLFRNVLVLGEEITHTDEEGDHWRTLSAKRRAQQLRDFRALPEHEPCILIVNYEQVSKHVDDFNSIGFDMVAYDEGHMLANPRSVRTKACHRIQGKRHLVLTGSPMLNNANELWSLLYRVRPNEFPNYYVFQNRYCVFGGFKDKQIVGVKNEKELTTKLNSVMVRRLKADVLDLPEKQRITVKVPLHPAQKELYDRVKEELYLPDPDFASGEDIANALTMFLRLKQICGTPAAIDPAYKDDSYKLDRAEGDLYEMVDNGHKVVVFTQFRGVLSAYERRVRPTGMPVWVLNGDVPKGERRAIVDRWARSSEPGALMCMHQVAGVGLTMTAARHMQTLDKLFVPKLNEQSEDRIHRIGADKTQPVQYFDYLCEGTVEYRVEQILRRKRRIFDDVVEDGNFRRKLYAALVEEPVPA